MTQEQKKAAYLVQNDFVNFRRSIINIWRDYYFVQNVILDYKKNVINKNIKEVKIENHNNKGFKIFHSNDINGICDRLLLSTNSKKALINAVSLTENYLQLLTGRVYKAYPDKINSKESVEAIGQQVKLIQVIFDSTTKEEIIDKLIEEKLRGIFYGNPIDFFEKDKAQLGFGRIFKEKYQNALKDYLEIINRRNINIHNQGKIDRKYLRETKSSLKLGTKPHIDEMYLKKAIMLLLGMASISTKIVLEGTFNANLFHKFIHSACNRFDKDYK